jgi:hypothetical protein
MLDEGLLQATMAQPVVHMDRTAAPALNTTVLQRFDPEIESVVVVASHVAMYENKTGQTEWVRQLRGGPGVARVQPRAV